LGFPIDESRRAAWYLVPEFLEIPILHALLDEVVKHPGHQTGAHPTKVVLERITMELQSMSNKSSQ
jgi:hypothetical protein